MDVRLITLSGDGVTGYFACTDPAAWEWMISYTKTPPYVEIPPDSMVEVLLASDLGEDYLEDAIGLTDMDRMRYGIMERADCQAAKVQTLADTCMEIGSSLSEMRAWLDKNSATVVDECESYWY